MSDELDLDAYLARIEWSGPTAPTLHTLAGVLRAHTARIPFENLDIPLGRGVRVDLPSVQTKLVSARRGGYCFEHATLLGAALRRLGFEVQPHVGRMTLRGPRTAAPRTHMFLVVHLGEGRFVVDPGFGSWTSRQPLLLDDGGALEPTSGYSMVRDGAWWVLRAPTPEGTIDGWASTLDEDNTMDAELANYYTATHPASPFVNHIMLRAFSVDGKVTVMNREASFWRGEDKLRTVTLPDRVALRALLAEHFGFDLPEIERLRVPAIPEWT